MASLDIPALFEKHQGEFLRDDRIAPERRLHRRPDIDAFMRLDRLMPGTRDMVSGAEHDEIWLGVDPADIAESATEEDIIDLIRCGVRYDAGNESFAMFV